MTIMPSSRKITFQSMPARSSKNAAPASVAWISNMIPAPPSAAATRCTFSVAISVYAPRKTATATHAVIVTRATYQPPADDPHTTRTAPWITA